MHLNDFLSVYGHDPEHYQLDGHIVRFDCPNANCYERMTGEFNLKTGKATCRTCGSSSYRNLQSLEVYVNCLRIEKYKMELKLESKPRTDDKGNNKKKQLTELLLSFIEDCKLVIDEGGNPYLVTPDRGVSDCGTKEFSDYIILRYHNATGETISTDAFNQFHKLISAKARESNEVRDIYIRVGTDGEYYYHDIGDKTHKMVRISSNGWDIVPNEGQVLFIRNSETYHLGEIERSGIEEINRLDKFLNLSDSKKLVFKALALSLLVPSLKYPIPSKRDGSFCFAMGGKLQSTPNTQY